MIDARRRHDGVCGVRPWAGAYGVGGEDDEGVEGFCSFSLMRNRRFDEAKRVNEPKNQGRHHRTLRTKRALPRHVGHGPRTQPSGGWEEPGGGI